MANRAQVLKQLHTELRGNYGSKWDADRDEACKGALNRLFDEIGPERLTKAVRSCIDREEFFEAAKIRDHIPSVSVKEADKNCSLCGGTSWMQSPRDPTRVTRCDCFTRGFRAVDLKQRQSGMEQ